MRSNYKIDNQTYTQHVQISQATNINNTRFSILIQKKKKKQRNAKINDIVEKKNRAFFLEKVHNVTCTLNVSKQKETSLTRSALHSHVYLTSRFAAISPFFSAVVSLMQHSCPGSSNSWFLFPI